MARERPGTRVASKVDAAPSQAIAVERTPHEAPDRSRSEGRLHRERGAARGVACLRKGAFELPQREYGVERLRDARPLAPVTPIPTSVPALMIAVLVCLVRH